ncbi:sugar ABC transporter permease [Reticulibacter mediterranei]|uniref:Sugar ABC transporter permease n=1 Tax=Reticulibacter mediterranei TaxID=2778369 RepID=A0A8J3J3Q4_9CHLR|nr:carbohydrate ABC transporter permease [Reticulibacter mediterranei]GHP00177.1 sugar ABC transporter permease [Reticulibacter mediterranei]
MSTQQKSSQTLLLTALGLFCTAIILFPLYWVIVSSLKNTVELFRSPPTLFPLQLDWSPYIDNFVQNQDMWHYMGNSVQIALGTMLLSLLLGTPIAYGLARLPVRGKNVFLIVFLVAQMFPSIMLALPLFVMFTRMGLINSLLAVVLAITTRTLPFAVLVLRPFFLSLPRDLEDAAFIDGCGLWTAFYRIILPLSRSGLLTVATLTFLMGWSDFLFPLALISDDTKRPLTLGLYKFISEYGTRWNDLMAVSTVAALPIVLVFIFAQRYITSGLVAGAVKD